ncbi:hypothetical protein KJB99_10230 [Staphylococcus epidermidis]|uniref:hypothetical protein n=1 Tax=Staphylococcus epidermidis TaxID=1282 RepID=UPI001F33C1BC|nr:hypothetical protein [Staphylococcus epidermidis]MCE5030068.1 hypothetical protein [Staphylococcus epidermidis]MCE5032374.1 hypothetical protein [Staphylococcus epidermidis]
MDNDTKQIIIGHIQSLLAVMEESNDPESRDRLDEQITDLMRDLNLTWKKDM